MPIRSEIDEARQLTVFTGTGDLSFEEVANAINSFYEKEHSLKVLWDLRSTSAREITSEQVEQIAHMLKEYGGRSEGIKTAIVTPVDINYGLSRMLISLLEIKEENYPVLMKVFRTIDEAIQWLL